MTSPDPSDPSAAPDREIQVRRATSSDAAVTSELFCGYLEFYGVNNDLAIARDFITARLEGNDSIVWLAALGDLPAMGFAQVYPTFSSLLLAPAWILNDLFILPRARRNGLARALISACVAEAQQADAAAIELATAHDNHAARRLYETQGFVLDTTYHHYTYKFDRRRSP
jgi:ribosomal protein S18 acetylase RimI-like enzyme